MHNSRIKRISLAVCLALMPFAADAAGLGKLTVFSGLGEPLNAEIELSASNEELSSLTARIAPPETYTEQGLDRPASLGALHVELTHQANGAPVIKLTSAQPVNDPFLDMLIQMEWSTGRLLREYTALLDPPGYGDQKMAATAAPLVAAPAAASSAPSAPAKSPQKPAKVRKATAPAPAPSATDAAPGEPASQAETYTTKSGDTLGGIAKQKLVEGVSLEQMLVGLYRTNQEAFSNGNMNRLKVGQIMRTPASEELQSLSQQEAVKEIQVHSADWQGYRNKLAGAVAKSLPQGEEAPGHSMAGKVTAPVEDKAAAAATGPRDVVKLSRSNAASAKSGAAETPAGQQAALKAGREDATARDKAAKDADERLALLDKQLQDMRKLLEAKNQTLADMQKNAAAAKGKPAVAPAPEPEVKKPVPAPTPAAPAVQVKPVEAPPAVVPPAPAPKKPATPPPVVAAAPELSPLDDPMKMGAAGGGLLALLVGAWIYLRNKRRKGLDSFEKGILTTSGLKPNTVFGNTSGGMVDTGDTSFLTDLSQGSGGMIDTNDVDPIAEAEVYMAYGRDVQAEEILKDAIIKEPRRYELHQKLLEIYANRKDTTAFETLAGELYATLGALDANWLKFAAMGRALEPENPLYRVEMQSVTATPDRQTATQEFSASVFDAPAEAELLDLEPTATPDFTESGSATDNALDFDLGLSTDDQPLGAAEPAPANEALPELDMEVASDIPEPAASSTDSNEVLDFSFDLPEPAGAENVQLDIAEIGLEPEPASATEVPDVLAMDTLPELTMEETAAPTAPVPAVEDLDFDLADLDVAEPVMEPVESADAALPQPELEPMPELEPESAPEAVQAEAPQIPAVETQDVMPELPDLDLELDFDLPDVDEALAAQAELPSTDSAVAEVAEADMMPAAPANEVEAEEIVLEAQPQDADDLDFDFDVDLDEATPPPPPSGTATPELPDLNLSSISLDLDEPVAPAAKAPRAAKKPAASITAEVAPQVEDDVEEIPFVADEPTDVDTKLDLVAAYEDMGDSEGARELLEEVLKEGGPKQRERAQAMLDKLG